MTETPIPKLVTSLAVPTVISMLVSNVYNMVDTFFVSRLGTSASGAVGITSTLALILLTFGLTFGHGAGSMISRALGSRQEKRASVLASTAFITAFAAGTVLALTGLCFLTPLMYLLGSTETVLPYARTYGMYILLAAPFSVSSYVMNNIMRYVSHTDENPCDIFRSMAFPMHEFTTGSVPAPTPNKHSDKGCHC